MNKFIPSNMNWKGWMKMVFHQPLIPVFPVAREILSKTKLIGPSRAAHNADAESSRPGRETEKKRTLMFHLPGKGRERSLHFKQGKNPTQRRELPTYSSQPLTIEPEPLEADEMGLIRTSHRRGFRIFHHHDQSSTS